MTVLHPSVSAGVTEALRERGEPPALRDARPVSGGCIHNGVEVVTEGGARYFVKWSRTAPRELFAAEAEGLAALGAAGALRVPEPLAFGGGVDSPSWLLMEFIAGEGPCPDFAELLGRGLAAIHASTPAGTPFGWPRDNWIGSLPQPNRPSTSWARFWEEERLAPQMTKALEDGRLDGHTARALERVLGLVPVALEDVEGQVPHLLHGDLWSGNQMAGPGGVPVLIDPAVYRGHGEVDLAMSELFGVFPPAFYGAYASVIPVSEPYTAYRRDLYQIYYLLVHLNLFGQAYAAPTRAAAERVAAALAD